LLYKEKTYGSSQIVVDESGRNQLTMDARDPARASEPPQERNE